jgi:hypothetical protein
MLKETTTYTDYDGTTVTEEMHFNLTQFELTEIAMSLPDKLTDHINTDDTPAAIVEKITTVLGKKGLLDFVKRMVIKAYGIKKKGVDGKVKFIKNDDITEEFANSMACHNFIMELVTDNDKSNAFFNSIVPSDMAPQIQSMIAEAKTEN